MTATPSAADIIAALADDCHDCRRTLKRGAGKVHCPAHADAHPSLSVTERDGKPLFKCFTGCSQDAVIEALRGRGLWPRRDGAPAAPPTLHAPKPRAERRREIREERKRADDWRPDVVYDYRDATGRLLFQVCRWGSGKGKRIFQRQPREGGGFWADTDGVESVLYRLPELLDADPAAIVFICAGEKDAERLRDLGYIATTNPGGEGPEKWHESFTQLLAGRIVVILVDNDATGSAHGQEVAEALYPAAASVKVVRLPGLDQGGDVSDWLDQGHAGEELQQLVDVWPLWQPKHDPAVAAQLETLQHDLEAARAELVAEQIGRAHDRGEIEHMRQRLHEYRNTKLAIQDVCRSTTIDQQLKVPVLALMTAATDDPKLSGIDEAPKRLFLDQARELFGVGNNETASRYLRRLEDEGFVELTREPLPKKETVLPNGKVVQFTPHALAIKLTSTQVPLWQRAQRLSKAPTGAGKRNAWGGDRRCPKHPDAPLKRKWYCSECGELVHEDVITPDRQDADRAYAGGNAQPGKSDPYVDTVSESHDRALTPVRQDADRACRACGCEVEPGAAFCLRCAAPPDELLEDLAAADAQPGSGPIPEAFSRAWEPAPEQHEADPPPVPPDAIRANLYGASCDAVGCADEAIYVRSAGGAWCARHVGGA